MNIVIATPQSGELDDFIRALESKPDVTVHRSLDAASTLEAVRRNRPGLVVADARLDDNDGVGLVQDIIGIDAMACIALVSDLPDQQFHDVTEGLGLLMQVPVVAGKEEADALWAYFCQVSGTPQADAGP